MPSALVEPALAPELLRDIALPHLTDHARRASTIGSTTVGSAMTASQSWLFGDDTNLAEAWAAVDGLPPSPEGRRWVAEPAHLTIAKDHLRLDDPRRLDCTPAEALALIDSAMPSLEAAGWRLESATGPRWFLRRDDDAKLVAPSIECAIDDNVADWQPRAVDESDPAPARAWRRSVNEVQMTWFDHPVNVARERRGARSINTLWLTGNGAPATPPPVFRTVTSSLPLLSALAIDASSDRTLETFDGLVEPALDDDWATWRDRLADLDARIAATAGGDSTVVLCGRRTSRTFTRHRRDRWRVWRTWHRGPTVTDLMTEPA